VKYPQFLRITVFLKKTIECCTFFNCYLSTNCAKLMEMVSNWTYYHNDLVSKVICEFPIIDLSDWCIFHRDFMSKNVVFGLWYAFFLIIHRILAWSFYVFIIYFKISLYQAQPRGFELIGWEISSKQYNHSKTPKPENACHANFKVPFNDTVQPQF